jgi:hypothetical protein
MDMITQGAPLRIFVNNDDEGTVTCPDCGRSKRINFAPYKSSHDLLKVKCGCGNVFKVIVELRHYYRKRTRLAGYYTTSRADKSGSMTVEDLSFSGLGFRTRHKHTLQMGDVIDLRFVLDNNARSEIVKKAIVRRIRDQFVGAEFCDLKAYDKELGYYLMPS